MFIVFQASVYVLTVERSQSISSNASGGADRRSSVLDSAPSSSTLKKKESSTGLPAQLGVEGAKEEGSVGTPLSNSFRPVTLTVQAFFKQVYITRITSMSLWRLHM